MQHQVPSHQVPKLKLGWLLDQGLGPRVFGVWWFWFRGVFRAWRRRIVLGSREPLSLSLGPGLWVLCFL